MWILQTPEEAEITRFTFRLPDGATRTIGRAPRADFILDAPLVSRLHCQVSSTQDGRLDVQDLDSTNGTFVNDKRVSRSALAAGDRLRVGRVELRVSRSSRP